MTTPEANHAAHAADEIVDHLQDDILGAAGLQLRAEAARTLRATCGSIIEQAIKDHFDEYQSQCDWPDD